MDIPTADNNSGYQHVVVTASTIIKQVGKYLLVQEAKPICYGKWNFPGGRVVEGDSLEATALRETKEETGFDVELLQPLPVYHKDAQSPVKHAYLARIESGELHVPKDEILDAKWFSAPELEVMKNELRDPWILQQILSVESMNDAQ